ncbi:MAG: hypothetical protein MZV70_51315 [Desulfobacterales bacterium]|nr:hypothetical protein [Desulfobacterales bacterium]
MRLHDANYRLASYAFFEEEKQGADRKAANQVRLITVTSGLALSLTGVKVVPIPRLT